VFLSLRDAYEEPDEALRERRGRLRGATFCEVIYRSPSASIGDGEACLLRRGGEADRDAAVEIVETEEDDTERESLRGLPLELSTDRDRFRPRSEAFPASSSSATPVLRRRSLGTSLVSLGASFGLRSWAVREGRAAYGRS
jgi:hypothetical protein